MPAIPLVRMVRIAGIGLAASLAAQSPRPAVLRGRVVSDSSDIPLRGAEVGIPELKLGVKTDSAGLFHLDGIPGGHRIVVVRNLGFAPYQQVMNFAAGDTMNAEFALVRTVQRVAAVTVKAAAPVVDKMADFESRRAAGFGHFITREMLVKNDGRRMSEIMALVPGNQVQRSKNSNTAWVIGARGTQSFLRQCSERDRSDLAKGAGCACYAAVFLDGAQVYGGNDGELLFDINSLRTDDVAGVEYYGGGATMPAQFNGTKLACGALVIWTRVR